jgi:hypothetical protein
MTITSINFRSFYRTGFGDLLQLPLRKQNAWLLFISYAFIVTWDWLFAFTLGVLTPQIF